MFYPLHFTHFVPLFTSYGVDSISSPLTKSQSVKISRADEKRDVSHRSCSLGDEENYVWKEEEDGRLTVRNMQSMSGDDVTAFRGRFRHTVRPRTSDNPVPQAARRDLHTAPSCARSTRPGPAAARDAGSPPWWTAATQTTHRHALSTPVGFTQALGPTRLSPVVTT